MKGIITNNLGLKVFSLLLAVMLELYLKSPDTWVTELRQVPVEIKNRTDDMMVIDPVTEELNAQVKFQGPSSQLRQIESFSPKFIVNLPIPNPTTVVAVLDEKQLRLPANVEVIQVKPASMELKLEKVVKKELPVEVKIAGTVAHGYQLGEVKAHPAVVVARGPQSELEGVLSVTTQMVDVVNLSAGHVFEVQLVNEGRFMAFNVNIVTVDVNISPVMSERTISPVTVKVIAPNGYAGTVEPSGVKLVLSGPEEALSALIAKNLTLVADGTKLVAGRHPVPLTIQLPPGVEMVRTIPPEVLLTLVTNTAEKEKR